MAASYGARIQFETVDSYFGYNPKAFPWHDWQGYSQAIEDTVSTSLSRNAPVFLWDIWNEPQLRSYDDPALVLETFDRAYTTIKTTDPMASVTGPAFNGWIPQGMEPFLDYLVENDMQFAAFNWHEFNRPEDVSPHIEAMREMIAARPTLGHPMINIDEYQNETQHLIPGFNLAWFYYLEQAEVDYAARACWNVQDAEHGVWNNCWRGLNGLFGYDNETPTTIYAVYASYAATDGQVRLATSSTESNDTVALASIDPATQIITILIGRFHSEQPTEQFASNVKIQLAELPYPAQQATVQITRIPNIRGQMVANTMLETMAPKPLLEPSILISDFQDGDVYVITLHPE